MYGLGHGGFESMVFVAGLAIIQLMTLLTLTTDQVAALPAAAQAQIAARFGQITEMPPWLLLAGKADPHRNMEFSKPTGGNAPRLSQQWHWIC